MKLLEVVTPSSIYHLPNMEDNLLPPSIMHGSWDTVNDIPNIHFTDPISKDHCITFYDSELKIPLNINGTFYFFHTRRPTADKLQSYEKILITPDPHHCNTYCTLYELSVISMLNYKGVITQANCQEHHLVYHEMDDVNIASITANLYDQKIDNINYSAYCALCKMRVR